MPSAQCLVEERTKKRQNQAFSEAPHKTLITMQTCLRCRRTFKFKRGRHRCPSCQGLLRNKTMILKIP